MRFGIRILGFPFVLVRFGIRVVFPEADGTEDVSEDALLLVFSRGLGTERIREVRLPLVFVELWIGVRGLPLGIAEVTFVLQYRRLTSAIRIHRHRLILPTSITEPS